MGLPTIFNVTIPISFIHIQGLLFLIELLFLLILGKIMPLQVPFTFQDKAVVNLTPWKYALPVSICLLGSIVFTFGLFSKIGLAIEGSIVSIWFWPFSIILSICTIVLSFIAIKNWKKKYLHE